MIISHDRRATINANLTVGHEYEVVVRAIGPDGTSEPMESAVRNTIVIQGKQVGPDPPSGLATSGYFNAVALSWTNPTNYDFAYTEVWRSTNNSIAGASKVAEVKGADYLDVIGEADVNRYYWIRAVNSSEVASGFHPSTTAGISGRPVGVTATDIADFSVTATKMFTNTIILNADAWTNNSPGAGSIAWNSHSVVYGGASYPITAGNTSAAYVYWTIGAATYSTSATHPTLGTTAFMIAVNTSGTHTLVWNSSANMVIGTAFIADLAVTDAKIANATITSAKISSLSADKISAGTITGSTLQTAAAGKRVVIQVSDNTLRFHTATVSDVILMDDTVSGSRPGMKIEDATNGVAVIIKKNATDQVSIDENTVSAYSSENSYNFYGYQSGSQTLAMQYLKRNTGTGPFVRYDLGAGKVFEIDETGAISTVGNVDGRDIATDGSKLDGIAAGAQPGTVTAVSGAAPVSSTGGTTPQISMLSATAARDGYMTSTYATKLDGIAAGAQPGTVTSVSAGAPLTSTGGTTPLLAMTVASDGVSGYMSGTFATKLIGIESGADVTDATNVGNAMSDTVHGNRGGGSLHSDVVAGVADGFMTATMATKLAGIETGADVTDQANVATATAAMGGVSTSASDVENFDITISNGVITSFTKNF